jgi:hypothetical protein
MYSKNVKQFQFRISTLKLIAIFSAIISLSHITWAENEECLAAVGSEVPEQYSEIVQRLLALEEWKGKMARESFQTQSLLVFDYRDTIEYFGPGSFLKLVDSLIRVKTNSPYLVDHFWRMVSVEEVLESINAEIATSEERLESIILTFNEDANSTEQWKVKEGEWDIFIRSVPEDGRPVLRHYREKIEEALNERKMLILSSSRSPMFPRRLIDDIVNRGFRFLFAQEGIQLIAPSDVLQDSTKHLNATIMRARATQSQVLKLKDEFDRH